ncbi:hypothetical protein KVG29_07250 [Caldicoprobacter algeriensis]|uniref:alpha-L-rhamnosidase-related protein n=1 Tax=Caldicoprobacter algeriensis TaxID=699281 RepID=UPI00207AD9ED|nr:alpha-L-rhamnosidase C-terminal domain-containing protein [Caldicoprobacter algeriensis]MCM8901026.1 hypothetical protein [Caldicoprobacter algeriensis]
MDRITFSATDCNTNETVSVWLASVLQFALDIGFFKPFETFKLKMKEVRYTATQKLFTLIASIIMGFVGTPYLCHVLSQNGYSDVAYKLLLQTDYPSWLYQVTKGATTIWEHWDGIKPDGSFWSPDMNSFNHYAYGSIGDWLYRVVAGIDTDEERTGYKHIYIRPTLGEGLTYAKAELKSMYGKIKSEWRIQDGCIEISVCVPHNTTATVVLPFATSDAVYESGKKLIETEGILEHETVDDGVKVEIGSGEYAFRYKMQRSDVALK